MQGNWTQRLGMIGPGLVIAATGLGAGDLVTASVAGATLGATLIWAVIVGAAIKFVLNEGLARWQLSTGTTLLQGWLQHLPRWVCGYFLVYLCLWALLVGAALMAACGLAAHALVPQLSINAWAAIHSLAALALVSWGHYRLFEKAMKLLIGLMFVVVISALWRIDLSGLNIASTLLPPRIPDGKLTMVLAVIGGVGGSVTVLCYAYWIREKGWQGVAFLPLARLDLLIAYGVTAAFAVGIMLLAASAAPETVSGGKMVLALADKLGELLGTQFRWVFLCGFWAAVFSSMLGVWQGVPYLFADFLAHWRQPDAADTAISDGSPGYRSFLWFLALPPMALLLLGKPVWLVILYSAAGALFMPFLGLTLLYLNNRFIAAAHRNSMISNVAILATVALFAMIALLKWV